VIASTRERAIALRVRVTFEHASVPPLEAILLREAVRRRAPFLCARALVPIQDGSFTQEKRTTMAGAFGALSTNSLPP